ncbi:hypothetical protein AB0L80_41235 [Streptomyces sp. NPDC052069]|uniref:hypothetical protein n=1 Tax=unclassified Streptomyces TaxID=2593676 RepID=UPI003448D00E
MNIPVRRKRRTADTQVARPRGGQLTEADRQPPEDARCSDPPRQPLYVSRYFPGGDVRQDRIPQAP